MRSRIALTGVLALAAVAPLAAQQQQAKEPAALPAGWSMRLDKEASKNAKFEAMGPGFHVTTGGDGAGIY